MAHLRIAKHTAQYGKFFVTYSKDVTMEIFIPYPDYYVPP